MARATKRHGHKRRGHNRGYWLRAGRGLMVTVDGQPEPLSFPKNSSKGNEVGR